MTTEFMLMHLMCAKICHDLAAPAGAVTMGLEMLEEAPQDFTTRKLIAFSAQSTIAKIELFRSLTGFAGLATKPTLQDIKQALKNYWPESKITLQWPSEDFSLEGPPARLLLAMILTAAEGLIRGGTLTIHTPSHLTAEGPSASLREDVAKALTGQTDIDQQSASTIIPYFTHTLAKSVGKTLEIHQSSETEFHMNQI